MPGRQIRTNSQPNSPGCKLFRKSGIDPGDQLIICLRHQKVPLAAGGVVPYHAFKEPPEDLRPVFLSPEYLLKRLLQKLHQDRKQAFETFGLETVNPGRPVEPGLAKGFHVGTGPFQALGISGLIPGFPGLFLDTGNFFRAEKKIFLDPG